MAEAKIGDLMFLFCMASQSKEEAFLNGFLMGLGSHLACPIPNWELMKEYPDSVDTEKHMREVFDKVHNADVDEAQKLLAQHKKSRPGV